MSQHYIPVKELTIGQQMACMKLLYPHFHYSRGKGIPVWCGTLQPRASSPEYNVKIEFFIDKHPRVWIINPLIKSNAPHLYKEGSLCLYCPRDNSWNARSWLAKTIVPWTAEWLFLYELWLETGMWWGLEASHNNSKSKKR
jgi:hypothetical protein